VAFVVGEPGIGKSRLLAELRAKVTPVGPGAEGRAPAAATAQDALVMWVEGRCVSYGRNLPYHLLIDIVRSVLDIPFVASEAETRATLDRQLASLLSDREWDADTAPYLAHLLALPLRPDEAERANLEGATIQARYVAAAHRLLRALAARGPVVLVCEDLHWADPASIEVVRQLLPLASQLPILFLAALRADTDSAGWALIGQARELFGDALAELRLEPLSEAESRTLVANLLEIESLPDHVRGVILSRAEGNPFFVEEVVRMLIERGVIVARGDQWVATSDIGTVEIPETLHGLLLARIDQLPASAKRSLRVAAVIGRQFPLRVLERILTATEVSAG
jgi:predicted ATPase